MISAIRPPKGPGSLPRRYSEWRTPDAGQACNGDGKICEASAGRLAEASQMS